MARAAIVEARARGALNEVVASVDDVNRASVRVLDKLGFVHRDMRALLVKGSLLDST